MQEHPARVVAHRTSPTNIGMSLLANLTAWDFGFITPDRAAGAHRATFDTMERMERYRGHFYNWYDTRRWRRCSRCTSRRSTAATWPATC
jgi:cyclic beta-1,2-glucan synthetase